MLWILIVISNENECGIEGAKNEFPLKIAKLNVNKKQPTHAHTRSKSMETNKIEWNEKREREREGIDQIKNFFNRCWFASVMGTCLPHCLCSCVLRSLPCPHLFYFSQHLTYTRTCEYTGMYKCIPHRISNCYGWPSLGRKKEVRAQIKFWVFRLYFLCSFGRSTFFFASRKAIEL